MLSLTTVNHNCQSQLSITTANHNCQSHLSITAVNHNCQSQLPITAANHNRQSHVSITTANHSCQSQLSITTANHMCQSQLSITAVNHIRTLLWRRRSWRRKQAAWQRRSHDSAWALPTPVKAGSSPTYVLLGQSNQSSHSATHFQPTCYNTRSHDKKSMFL